jgi:isopentenyldiphosphate isomerase
MIPAQPSEAQNLDELFEIVDESDRVVGLAKRRDCHGNPALTHRTAHVVVYHPDGRLLLQKRSAAKDVQPGKWDTAVGGHLAPGEDYASAARREMAEELGLPVDAKLDFLFKSSIRNSIESENVGVYATVSAGPFKFNPSEIDELRFWSKDELLERMAQGAPDFTPNLVVELKRLLKVEDA